MNARTYNRAALCAGVMALFSAAALWAQTTNPMIGTWELNLAKSSFSPGPPPKSQTRTYEDRGAGLIVYTYVGVDAQDKPTFSQYAAKCDGKDYPFVWKTRQGAFSVACKELDTYTTEYYEKEDGKPTLTSIRVISKDGKTATVTTKGKWLDGQAVHDVRVLEKQR